MRKILIVCSNCGYILEDYINSNDKYTGPRLRTLVTMLRACPRCGHKLSLPPRFIKVISPRVFYSEYDVINDEIEPVDGPGEEVYRSATSNG